MDKEAFIKRMQLYKLAKGSNPLLKYWDWKNYADGGVVEKDPPTIDPKGLIERSRPIAGGIPVTTKPILPVFNLYDAPIIGDAMSIYDAGEAVSRKDWLTAGIAAASVVPFVPKIGKRTLRSIEKYFELEAAEKVYNSSLRGTAKESKYYIPTVKGYKENVESQINKLTKIDPNLEKLQQESEWNNLINREIEKIYDPEVRKRAAKIDNKKGTELLYYYDDLHRNYTDNYNSVPKAKIVDDLDYNARALMTITDSAREALLKSGKKPSWGDFEMLVSKDAPLDPEVAQHEIAHFNQYMNNKDADLNKLPYGTGKLNMKKDNPYLLDGDPLNYFDNVGEQGAYLLTIVNDMMKKGIPVTLKSYIKYVKRLPKTSSKRKAVEQFNTYKDAYNWTKMMPLTGIMGYTWLNNNEQNETDNNL